MIFNETKKNNPNSKESEDKLQADCFQWFHNTYPTLRGLMYHVPNGEKRDPVTANLLKAKGVVPGVPDLEFHYRGKTYFFELKKPNGKGSLSENQNHIHKQLDGQRFIIWVINDLEIFKNTIKSIVSDTSNQFTFGLTKEEYYYKHKVFDFIYGLEHNQKTVISDICEENNIPLFWNILNEFIVEGFASKDNFEIKISPDFKMIVKIMEGIF